MKQPSQKLAVIYANESNIWDNNKKEFHYSRNRVDENGYSMPLDEAKRILQTINNERAEEGEDEAYIVELPDEQDEDKEDVFNTLADITKPSNMHPLFAQILKPFGIR